MSLTIKPSKGSSPAGVNLLARRLRFDGAMFSVSWDFEKDCGTRVGLAVAGAGVLS